MKILIGTPIHEAKDYSMERWLKNVAELQKISPADIILIDNSSFPEYIEKVKGYCEKYGVKNYSIEHIEIDQNLGSDIRIERSQEIIRQYVLSHNYDVWFSWECDEIIPKDALRTLMGIMEEGKSMMVVHDSLARWDRNIINTNMGITLISRECLERNWFLPMRNGEISSDIFDYYDINDPTVYKRRVLKSGGSYIEVFGMLNPIYHLNN